MSVIASPSVRRAKQSNCDKHFVYLMTNQFNTILYTGSTNDLKRRLAEHRSTRRAGFAQQYRINKLVYYEKFNEPLDAVSREKQLKAGPRRKKVALIDSMNPEWLNLSID